MASRRGDTFGKWLLAQTRRSGPIGELARDYKAPCGCPACAGRTSRRYSVAGVREELARHAAKPDAYAALEAAEAEWRQAQEVAA